MFCQPSSCIRARMMRLIIGRRNTPRSILSSCTDGRLGVSSCSQIISPEVEEKTRNSIASNSHLRPSFICMGSSLPRKRSSGMSMASSWEQPQTPFRSCPTVHSRSSWTCGSPVRKLPDGPGDTSIKRAAWARSTTPWSIPGAKTAKSASSLKLNCFHLT